LRSSLFGGGDRKGSGSPPTHNGKTIPPVSNRSRTVRTRQRRPENKKTKKSETKRRDALKEKKESGKARSRGRRCERAIGSRETPVSEKKASPKRQRNDYHEVSKLSVQGKRTSNITCRGEKLAYAFLEMKKEVVRRKKTSKLAENS